MLDLCCWVFAHVSRFGDFIWWCILIVWHVFFGDVWFISAGTVEKFYICMMFGFWYEDVSSISWIFALFACIIALIEIGRYNNCHCKCEFHTLFPHQIQSLEHRILSSSPSSSTSSNAVANVAALLQVLKDKNLVVQSGSS